MSSPLDARIRKVAREEAERLSTAAPAAVLETSGPDRLDVLEKEVADLRARLDAVEKTAEATDQEEKPTARRTRKPASTE